MPSNNYIGVDGCQSGWLCVERSSKELLGSQIHRSIDSLWEEFSEAKVILIDMPIGLLEKGEESRKTDKAARILLTRKRSSSVFPIPCRAAVYADNYDEANYINREKTGKGVSKQSWNICSRIRELDQFLIKNMDLKEKIIESHPEVCFTILAGKKPMNNYKRTEEGYEERIVVLRKYDKNAKVFVEKQLELIDNKQADRDDVVDACVLAISASFGYSYLKFLPEDYELDTMGLPMRMAYPNPIQGDE